MDPELKQLIAKAVMQYDRMTPEQRTRHNHEQRRSFVRGMCPADRDYREWCAIVDKLLPPSGPPRPSSWPSHTKNMIA